MVERLQLQTCKHRCTWMYADTHRWTQTHADERKANCVQCVGGRNLKTHQDVRRLFKDFRDTLYLQVMHSVYTCLVSVLYCPTTTLVEHDSTVVMLWRQSGRALSGCKTMVLVHRCTPHPPTMQQTCTQPQQPFKQPHMYICVHLSQVLWFNRLRCL